MAAARAGSPGLAGRWAGAGSGGSLQWRRRVQARCPALAGSSTSAGSPAAAAMRAPRPTMPGSPSTPSMRRAVKPRGPALHRPLTRAALGVVRCGQGAAARARACKCTQAAAPRPGGWGAQAARQPMLDRAGRQQRGAGDHAARCCLPVAAGALGGAQAAHPGQQHT